VAQRLGGADIDRVGLRRSLVANQLKYLGIAIPADIDGAALF